MTHRHLEEPVVDHGPRSGPDDALVLDIGGDIGALVLYADECLIGREIDLTPASEHVQGVHTAIRRRRANGADVVCGVYPQLLAGRYTVCGVAGSPIGTVVIEGGRVTEVDAADCRSAVRLR